MLASLRTLSALLFVSAALPLLAQVDTAVVSGTVHDPSGALVPGSHVSLRNRGTGVVFDTTSNGSGEYQFPVVPIGDYEITVERAGFMSVTTAPFHLDVSQRERVDADLKSLSDTQTVTVSSDIVAVLDSDTSDRGQVISRREIVGLPLNGRNYADLALLAPGVSRSGLENQTNTSRDASFNVNGVRSTLNNFVLDGLDNNSYSFDNNGYSNQANQVSPDGLAEFKLETDNYNAEYGRAGGGIINAATRSGTEHLRGTIWEYLRNTYTDAEGPFALSGQAPTLNQNQFGGAVGGKILPARLFFFADYEGLRRSSHNSLTSTLPTAAQRAGTFTDTTGKAIAVRDPYVGTVYSTGQLPGSAFTPLANLVLAALPLPNNPGFSSNYTIFPAARYESDKGDGRLDYFLNSRWNFFGRYSQNNIAFTDPPPIPGAAGGYSKGNLNILIKQVAVGANWLASSRSTVDARFGWTTSHSNTLPPGFGQPVYWQPPASPTSRPIQLSLAH